jgi:hypothetical protein
MSDANDGMMQPLVDLQRLAAGIRWRRRLWGGLALAGLVGGVLAGIVLPGASSASAQVYVVHKTEDSGDPTATTKTDLALLKSTAVAGEAIARVPVGEPAEDYVEEYAGEVVAANVLRITAPGRDDQQAVANARALADAFVAVYVRQSDARAQAEVRALDDRRRAVQRELAALGGTPDGAGSANRNGSTDRREAAASDSPGRAERTAALNAQLSAIEQLAVQAEIGTPQIAAGTMVIDVARVTSRSHVVNAVLYGLIGLLVGLGGGLALAAVLTVARDRPVLRRDIGAHLGASVIAQIPPPMVGRIRLPLGRKGRARAENERVAATLARLVRHGGPVSVLELGCRRATVELVGAMAAELATDSPVEIVDDLPDGGFDETLARGNDSVQVVDGADVPSEASAGDRADVRRLGVGTVEPGTRWTDLRRLGDETILVVRAGKAEASWLHTVARQLADEGIAVVGVVVVQPDPRDRSDGTLWDPLHTALRGRVAARSGGGPATAETPPTPDTAAGPAGLDGGEQANPGAATVPRPTPRPRTVTNGNDNGNATVLGYGKAPGNGNGNGNATGVGNGNGDTTTVDGNRDADATGSGDGTAAGNGTGSDNGIATGKRRADGSGNSTTNGHASGSDNATAAEDGHATGIGNGTADADANANANANANGTGKGRANGTGRANGNGRANRTGRSGGHRRAGGRRGTKAGGNRGADGEAAGRGNDVGAPAQTTSDDAGRRPERDG